MTEREANVRSIIERKSLLPRMIYLSIQSASTSLKENLEVNGSRSDPKIPSELKVLLEHYAKMLGYSFADAIEVVLGVSSGLKSFEVILHHKCYSTLLWLHCSSSYSSISKALFDHIVTVYWFMNRRQLFKVTSLLLVGRALNGEPVVLVKIYYK